MRTATGIGPVVVAGVVTGSLAAACGGSTSSGGLNDPATLASVVKGSTQHQLDAGTAGVPAGTKVTSVSCASHGRFRFTCDVHLDNGQERALGVMTAPGGKSYVVTSGAF